MYKKVLNTINYQEIIDKILQLGNKHKLTEILINILKERDIDIYKASKYLEDNKENFEDTNKYKKFIKVAPYI